MPPTIWSARRETAEEGVQQSRQAAGDHADCEPQRPLAGDVGAPDGEERSHEHHALEADVDDPGALGEQAADRGEDERRRIAERRSKQCAPYDDGLEVLDARAGREVADHEPEHAGRDRVAADPTLTPDPRADADRERKEPNDDRRDRAPYLESVAARRGLQRPRRRHQSRRRLACRAGAASRGDPHSCVSA